MNLMEAVRLVSVVLLILLAVCPSFAEIPLLFR